MGKLRTVIR